MSSKKKNESSKIFLNQGDKVFLLSSQRNRPLAFDFLKKKTKKQIFFKDILKKAVFFQAKIVAFLAMSNFHLFKCNQDRKKEKKFMHYLLLFLFFLQFEFYRPAMSRQFTWFQNFCARYIWYDCSNSNIIFYWFREGKGRLLFALSVVYKLPWKARIPAP